MTEQQTLEQLNPTAWQTITTVATALGRNMTEVEQEIRDTAEEPYLATQGDLEARLRISLGIVAARLIGQKQSGRETETYEAYVFSVGTPRKTRNGKAVASAHAIVAKADDASSEPQYAVINFWEDETAKVSKIQVNTAYKAEFSSSLRDGVLNLNSEPNTNFNTTVDLGDLNVIDILKQVFPVISIGEAAGHVRQGFNDYRLVRGSVAYASTFTRDDGTGSARINIFDMESGNPDEVLTVWAGTNDAQHGDGSVLWFLGSVTKNDRGLSFQSEAVIPEFSIPRPSAFDATSSANDDTETFNFEDAFES